MKKDMDFHVTKEENALADTMRGKRDEALRIGDNVKAKYWDDEEHKVFQKAYERETGLDPE